MSARDDEEAVDRVRHGDTAAFEEIVRRWQGPMVNLAYRFVRDRGRAEDMAQDAFVRAFRALSSWRRDSAFSTWLFALATNLYRSELRRIPARVVPIDSIREPVDPRSRDAERDDEDRDRLVRRMLHTLPVKYRDALVLFYFHEMDVAATARSLRLKEGTVKARLSRGRDMLRKKLAHLLHARTAGDGDGTR